MPFSNSFMTINIWDSLVLCYFGYEVILFQIFFKYQNPENKLSYVTNPEFRINLEIFHPWSIKKMNEMDYGLTEINEMNYGLK